MKMMIFKVKEERKESLQKMYICVYCQHRQGLWPATRQTCPFVREDAPRQTKSQNLVMSPRGAECQDGLTDSLTVSRKVTLTGW